MALDFSSKSASGFSLSEVQMLALRGRYLGYNTVKIAEITGRVPSTLSEHLQRAYHKLGFNKPAQLKIWMEDTRNNISAEEFEQQYGKKRGTPVEQIKEKKAAEEQERKIHQSMSEAMSEIHEEIGNNNYARY